MATSRIPILGAFSTPDGSGEVFFEPYTIKDTAAVVDPLVLIFNDSGTKDGIRGMFTVPEDFSSGAKLVIIWTSSVTSGNCINDLSILTRSGIEDMGAAATRTTDTVTQAKSATAFARTTSTMTLTDSDFAAGDQVLFDLFRDTANASDTMAAAQIVFEVLFEYTTV